MSAPTLKAPSLGHLVAGKYKLLALLGSGGMGAVYRAENTWTTRQVALKIMRPELSSNADAVARFMREAQSSARIAHPNIVDVFDMGQDSSSGAFYIVQELLTGTDLRHRLDRVARLSPIEALEIIVPIMGALVAAARRGIVHRDIKPENIFLARGPDGAPEPKLIDFGISKIVDDSSGPSNTRTGFTMGTPNYMSPEQARGDSTIDERSDVWAIGVVLYEMLAGVCPFEDRTPNLVLVKILRDRPAPLDTVVTDLPRWLVAAVHRALAYDRTARFASMHAFLSELLAHDVAPMRPGDHTLSERFEASLRDHRALASGEAEQISDDEPTEIRRPGPNDGDDATLVTPSPARRLSPGDGIVSLPSALLPDKTLPPASGMRGQNVSAMVAVAAAALPTAPPAVLPQASGESVAARPRVLSLATGPLLRRYLPAVIGAIVTLVAIVVVLVVRGASTPDAPASAPQAPPQPPQPVSPPSTPPAPSGPTPAAGGPSVHPAAPSGAPTRANPVRPSGNPAQPTRPGATLGPTRPPVVRAPSVVRREPAAASTAHDAGARARPCGPLEACARYPH